MPAKQQSKIALADEGPALKVVDKAWNTKNLGWRLGTDALGGYSAAAVVAPIIAIIDKGIMQNASGQATLKESLKTSFKSFLLRPHSLIFSKPYALIVMLYGGTYLTANTLDTITSTIQNKPASTVSAGTLKFFAPAAANIGLCLIKDRQYAQMFGTGPPRPVGLPTFALFTLRDCMTIFASFNVPPMLGPVITRNMSEEWQKSIKGQTIAQFLAPAGVQLLSTPMHLLGLDLYNRSDKSVTRADRIRMVTTQWLPAATARICRIVPAFGFGNVVNTKVRKTLMNKLE
ncbi:hypothetical protein BP5796_05260 [Coleophoma crateriformis]|uniref:Sequence orphan n=1 Tax=Coleophoma crateriformis TaxID=565419 RepID=A0A3D8S2P0_9HELO|nr:hypothetical protein BP5796_05260 [Coleophoma crateriformis]